MFNSQFRLMTKKGVLMEPCDRDYSCNLDANIFKGIFVRNLRYLMDVTKNKSQIRVYKKFLDTNIASINNHSKCVPNHEKNHTCHIVYLDGSPAFPATGPVYDAVWLGPFNQSRPIQQTSALDLLVAGSEEDVRCHGHGCHYDPHNPAPKPLTCQDDPCPSGQECCEYNSQYTCCAPGQKCMDNYCQ